MNSSCARLPRAFQSSKFKVPEKSFNRKERKERKNFCFVSFLEIQSSDGGEPAIQDARGRAGNSFMRSLRPMRFISSFSRALCALCG
jgi:hypothetical protein